jgi:hypothetical protein
MQNGVSSKPTGPVLAGIGGVLLAIGAVLTWATASLDITAFAQALGIDPSQIPAGSIQTSKSFAGTSGSDGKIALVCGIIVLLLAIGVWARGQLRVPFGILTIVGGLVGGGLALYDISKKGDIIASAKETAGPALAQLGIDPGILDSIFKVSLGIGIWICVVGGALAVVGGLLILMQKSAAPAAAGGMSAGFTPPPADAGFGTSSVTGSMSPPPAAPAATMEAPAEAPAAPVAEPAPEPMPPIPGADDEGDASSSS